MYSLTHSKKAFGYQKESQPLLSMRFPQKLWRIVNECRTGAIRWSKEGNSIVLNYPRFQEDYLDSNIDIFKTSNITSFIRQLNLYGFRKVNHYNRESNGNDIGNPDVHEFKNDYFTRGRKDLLSKVSRKSSTMKTRLNCRRGGANSSSSSSRIAKCQMALREALKRQHMILSQRKYNTHHVARISVKAGGNHKNPNESNWWNSQMNNGWNSQMCNLKDCPPLVKQESTSTDENSDIWDNRQHINVVEVETSDPKMHKEDNSDVNSLLDPTTSPKNFYYPLENDGTSLEDSLTMDSVFSHMDNNLSEKIYHILMTEDNKENKPPYNSEAFSKAGWSNISNTPLVSVDCNSSYAYIPGSFHHSYPHAQTAQLNPAVWEMRSPNKPAGEQCYFFNSGDMPFYDLGIYDNQTLLQLYH